MQTQSNSKAAEVAAQLDMQNNILTAAKVADVILNQDLKSIIEEKSNPFAGLFPPDD